MESNESVYPCGDHNNIQPEYGLTKLEYFTGQALIGILANGKMLDETCIADTAVCIAHKIINALNNPNNQPF